MLRYNIALDIAQQHRTVSNVHWRISTCYICQKDMFLSFLLNAAALSIFLTLSGNFFHNKGPLTLNDRDSKVYCLVFGPSRLTVALDDRGPSLSISFTISSKYFGASP